LERHKSATARGTRQSTAVAAPVPFPDPVGRRIRIGNDPGRQDIQVVGVVSDARIANVRDPNAQAVYVPFLQEPKYIHSNSLEIQTDGDPNAIANTVRREIESLGHEYAIRMMTLSEVRDRALLRERILAILTLFLALWRCCSPESACTAFSRMQSRDALARLASAWRWVQAKQQCSG